MGLNETDRCYSPSGVEASDSRTGPNMGTRKESSAVQSDRYSDSKEVSEIDGEEGVPVEKGEWGNRDIKANQTKARKSDNGQRGIMRQQNESRWRGMNMRGTCYKRTK